MMWPFLVCCLASFVTTFGANNNETLLRRWKPHLTANICLFISLHKCSFSRLLFFQLDCVQKKKSHNAPTAWLRRSDSSLPKSKFTSRIVNWMGKRFHFQPHYYFRLEMTQFVSWFRKKSVLSILSILWHEKKYFVGI